MAFDPLEIHHTFARYNAWMNEKLLASCSTLSDEARKQPLSIPFGSLHGVWNHLMVGDHLWLGRFENSKLPFEFLGLEMELYSDWDELRGARVALDEHIGRFAESLTIERLDSDLHWISATNPTPRISPFVTTLAHFWNHQTHHRGQITATMELLGLDCGVTDLLALPGVIAR
ncbi:hypothetical protein IAD21_01982 [Abditibacteriota bacterium]|nr:hypothetical protein IAD21_01982 [Abditibacteriota bacterium]